MTNSGDVPELEPLEESAAAAPPPQAAGGVTAVSLPGLPAPVFGTRAQTEYYRFFFAGLIMFLGCMMPFGPEWEMAGYQSLGGAVFTLISLGIMWSSWVAISHGKFDLSSIRWLILSTIPLTVMIYHVWRIWEEPAVIEYIKIVKAQHAAEIAADPSLSVSLVVIEDWSTFFDYLVHFKTTDLSNAVDNFVRAFGPGKIVLLFGSLYAFLLLIKGVGSGLKAGKARKQAQAAARAGKGGGKGGKRR